jgi:hypothetical protein
VACELRIRVDGLHGAGTGSCEATGNQNASQRLGRGNSRPRRRPLMRIRTAGDRHRRK